MSLKRETLRRVRSRDFESIEDEWLERLDGDPIETSHFTEVAQVLADADQTETVRPLLRLVDEELADRGDPRQRLDFLLEVGHLFLRLDGLHESVVEILRRIYAKSRNLDAMLRVAGLHRAPGDLRTLQRQVERFHALMLLDEGSLIRMEGKGVGTITEINFDLGRYKVDFERIAAVTIGFKAGAKLLQPIPEKHILRYKMEDPDRLKSLRDDAPSELLREVLESYPEPLTAAQIKGNLEGIVSPKQWSKWWTAARKSPQVLVTADKRHRYHWAASTDDAAAALAKAFKRTDLAGQLDLFTKNARQNPDLAGDMAESLTATAKSLVATAPEQALEIWHTLSRADMASADADFAPAAIVAGGTDVASLAGRVTGRAVRESLYDEVRAHRDEWPEILTACALREEDPGLVGKLVEAIGAHDGERRARLIDRILARPKEHPGAFVWLAQAAAEDPDLRRERAPRLFRQLLRASGLPQFTPYKAALGPLLESGGTLPKLIPELEEDDAVAALAAVERSRLEDYLKSPLATALELRFTSLRSETDDSLYALRESIEERREEARRLKEEEIPANRTAIQEAAALGDLRENFEYKSARQRHEYLSARLAALQADLSRVQPIELDRLSDDEVRIGSSIDLEADGSTRVITLLGPWESDPEAGRLSYQSDLGKALLGARVGDSVELDGRTFEITGIGAYTGG